MHEFLQVDEAVPVQVQHRKEPLAYYSRQLRVLKWVSIPREGARYTAVSTTYSQN